MLGGFGLGANAPDTGGFDNVPAPFLRFSAAACDTARLQVPPKPVDLMRKSVGLGFADARRLGSLVHGGGCSPGRDLPLYRVESKGESVWRCTRLPLSTAKTKS